MAVQKKNGREAKVTEGDGNIHRRGDGLGTGPVGTGGRGENNTGVDPEQAKAQAAAAAKAAEEAKAGVKPSGSGVRPSGQGAKPGQGQSAADNANDRGLLDDLVSISNAAGGQQTSQQSQQSGVDLSSLLGGGQQSQQSQSGLSGLSGLADLLGGGQQQSSQQSQQSGLSGLADLLGGGQQQSSQQSQQSGLSGLSDLLTGGSSSGSSGSSGGSSGGSGGTPVTGLFGGSSSSGSSGSSGSGKKMSLLKLILFIVAAIIIISLLSKMCNSGVSQYGDDTQNLPIADNTSQAQPSQTQPAETQPAQTQPAETSESYTLPEETTPIDEDATYYSDDIQSILAALLSGSGAGSFTGTTSAAESAQTVQTESVYNTWDQASVNTNTLDTTVSAEPTVRAKYTNLLGGGKDTVTIMVYMCGTDLESKYGCATKDMQEMLAAKFGENVRILIYTGGCKKWNNKVMSSSVNQIYLIQGQQLYLLEKDMGQKSMVDPATLTEFIKYCVNKYPQTSRNMLIFWDHGGGSVSGYGYDEKYSSKGSMSLAGINTALANAGVQFDMIGFDACLMATAETALMLDKYCDYMVASEESEPGIGWYYTDWLNKLGSNTSVSTTELGKTICDSFVSVCGSKARGQSATLSVVDVAEFAGTVPAALSNFSKSTTELIKNNNYQSVAKARSSTREFARSSRIDQIDLVDFLNKLGTDEAKALKQAVLGAVKYNTTSSDMTNCYGVSIFFPYQSARTVDAAVATYNKIGLGEDYSKCIQEFAAMECSGSASFGGSTGSASSLLGLLGGGTNSSSSYTSSGDISSLLGALLGGGDYSSLTGLDSSNTGFFTGRSLTLEETADFIYEHQFDPGYLNWVEDGDDYVIRMPLDNWEMVTDIAMSMYYNDGEGYIDLGVDNVYQFDDKGNLLAPSEDEVTWLAIGGQGVAYYYLDSFSDGENFAIHGYVPAFLNGERVRLLLIFDNEHPQGYIAGALPVYDTEETDQVAKSISAESDADENIPFEVYDSEGELLDTFESGDALMTLKDGDQLDFICDYYTYEGEYQDSFYLGDPVTYTADIEIANFVIPAGCANMMYRFTDIYNQVYWSEALLN